MPTPTGTGSRGSRRPIPTLHPTLTKPRFGDWSRGRHIYFIQGRKGGLIKIGSANDPWARLREFQVMCPIRLRLIGMIWEGDAVRERHLHERFKHLRRHGEWFRPAPDLLTYIAEYATDPYDPPVPSEMLAEALDSIDPGAVS